MKENLKVEENVALAILNNGVKYNLGEETIVIRPLLFGTILMICQRVCEAGLTLSEIEAEDNIPSYLVKYGNLMLECVSIAELNRKEDLTEERIRERSDWYRDNLTAFQIYELFIHVWNLSGIEAFTNTIRLIWMIKKTNLSPKIKGSYEEEIAPLA